MLNELLVGIKVNTVILIRKVNILHLVTLTVIFEFTMHFLIS